MAYGSVAEAVNVPRRDLERRFRKVLGRSVLNEIKRIRIERIIQMLVETDLPISLIALTLGYNSDKHISRYFRQKTGTSPLAYRKQYGRR